jgi:tRNA A37 threonylcarbamoyltransferase TsaD
MATKTKGTNAKIKELKGIKPEKVSEKHLEQIQEAVSEINKTYLELGRIAATQHAHLHNVTVKQNALNELQDELTKEYGTNDIDITTGVINHAESV